MPNAEDQAVIDGVTKAEEARCLALNSHDFEGLAELIHEDFLYTHAVGRVDTKDSWIAHIKPATTYQIVRETLNVRPFGNVAVTTGDITSGRVHDDGQRHNATKPIIQIWVNNEGQWQEIAHYSVKQNPPV